jgi:shikimate dehydrogenase
MHSAAGGRGDVHRADRAGAASMTSLANGRAFAAKASGCCELAQLRHNANGTHEWNGNDAKMIRGTTSLIAHLGYPTETFKAPMIYNPYFEHAGVDAVVVPMGIRAEHYAAFLRPLFRLENIHGALVTMPHKVSTATMLDDVTPTVRVAGACNAIVKRPDGSLAGDMFDGGGFVRGVLRKGRSVEGARALVVGAGGVGSAIAASLAAAQAAVLGLFDTRGEAVEQLANRLHQHYRHVEVRTGSNDPAGYDIAVNATPLGMKAGDPLPFDVNRLTPGTLVGEVVLKEEYTPLLRAAVARDCPVQVGTDMLYEMIPAYLEFFGFPTTTPDMLRAVARIRY